MNMAWIRTLCAFVSIANTIGIPLVVTAPWYYKHVLKVVYELHLIKCELMFIGWSDSNHSAFYLYGK